MASSQPRTRSVKSICKAHGDGLLEPKNRRHVLAQLKAEGHKRVESFLFEQIFIRLVTTCTQPQDYTFGWSFQYDSKNTPKYWFKLETEVNTWNNCDNTLLNFLVEQGCDVIRVHFDDSENSFFGSRLVEGSWQDKRLLLDILKDVTGRKDIKISPRNYNNINYDQQRIAINKIGEIFTDEELYYLSISRLLTNCHIVPAFNKQLMDIDACVTINGSLKFLEFKRKYPARNGAFGIDNEPHGIFIDWLTERAKTFLHIILCDPLWNKDESPIHLLEPESVTADYAIWIGATLSASSFGKQSLSTYGRDSGMLGGIREQRIILPKLFQKLGTGLDPNLFCQFINGNSDLPNLQSNELILANQTAKKIFRQS